MKTSYQHELALPPDVAFAVTWEADAAVNQAAVDTYVNSLARPGWYVGETNRLDTRLYMLEVRQPFVAQNIDGKLTRTWHCDNCHNLVLYEGVQLGHARGWRDELKRAAVKTPAEAKAAYNNLNNLRVECSTCNASHDWE